VFIENALAGSGQQPNPLSEFNQNISKTTGLPCRAQEIIPEMNSRLDMKQGAAKSPRIPPGFTILFTTTAEANIKKQKRRRSGSDHAPARPSGISGTENVERGAGAATASESTEGRASKPLL